MERMVPANLAPQAPAGRELRRSGPFADPHQVLRTEPLAEGALDVRWLESDVALGRVGRLIEREPQVTSGQEPMSDLLEARLGQGELAQQARLDARQLVGARWGLPAWRGGSRGRPTGRARGGVGALRRA